MDKQNDIVHNSAPLEMIQLCTYIISYMLIYNHNKGVTKLLSYIHVYFVIYFDRFLLSSHGSKI